ncbi:F-type H+-transporting ATPase subunit delta [Pullulanibacillus pueri]|uniref:ATP synthase subunit delta n=1 Tax=Pullulanibacillus pueri TaxID=1437324 RepID=A0A8J2ZWT9_9BACL|nr:F0F1 ATP synthase subunit delta [Pullulanibacillus pueri]MBM7681733.1 F-type H+-transporting ATPase subunit delta [Pullulanibacillus pueri]GGH84083.1 ATP synthase subunit delta [Pullulanibacillus pueri]
MSVVVAKRYAGALFEVAKERGTIDAVEEQLGLVNQIVAESTDLKKMLYFPGIAGEVKKKVVEEIFKTEVNGEVLNLLKILIDRRRESILEDLQASFVEIANDYRGILDVNVTTASPLDKDEEEKIMEAFGQIYDKKLRLHTKVDPKVIGGVLVKVGNRLYDGTLSGKLNRFHQELKSGR